jgi:PAS domain S-box-containing protein
MHRILNYWSEVGEDRFEPLFETAPLMIHSIDETGRLLRVSRFWLDTMGYREDEVIGRKSSDFLTEASRVKAVTEVLPAFFRDGVCRNVEYEFVRADGSILDVALTAVAERDAAGAVTRSLAVLVDISDRLNAERKMVKALERAEAASAAKSEFLSAMSHELRTPMNAIIGFTGLLRQSELSPKQHEWAGHVLEASDSLMGMIADLLDLAKMEAGKFSIHPMSFDLHRFIDELEDYWSSAIAEAGLRFRVERDPNLPRTITTDPTRLQQIVSNYLDNARKYTEQGSVTLRFLIQDYPGIGPRVLIEVTDTGPGIDESLRPVLFERFTQGGARPTKPDGGWGLGLSIVRELADQLGGAVGIVAEDSGTTFWVEIPHEGAAEETEAAEAAVSPIDPTPAGVESETAPVETLRILVVEDNELNQALLSSILTVGGFDFTLASTGREAIEAAAATRYDLILMDIQMPEMDGLTAARAIRATDPVYEHTPIIAVTANAGSQARDKYLNAGLDDFIPKPFSPPEILGAIERARLSH